MTEPAFRFLLGAAAVLVLALASPVIEESSCAEGENCTTHDDQNALLQWDMKTRSPCAGKTCGEACLLWSNHYQRGLCSSEGKCLTTGEAPNCAKKHYCKRDAADYKCYKKGHPRCCTDGDKGNCPEKKPLCELPHVCQDKEHFPCACTGTVYFGRKYAHGYPGSGEAIPLGSMKQSVTKKVAGEITCAHYSFGSDPAVGYYKRCVCVPDQAPDEAREEQTPAPLPVPAPTTRDMSIPPLASYRLMKRAGCTGGKKYSYDFIEDSDECAEAEKTLDLGAGESRVIYDRWRPYGCYVARRGGGQQLYFNHLGNKTSRTASYSSICLRQSKSKNPCKKKVCGQTCVVEGDMAGKCTAEGKCSLDVGNVDCGSFKKMSGATCETRLGFQFIESKKECRTAAVALGMEPKVGNSNATKRPYGCYSYFKKGNGALRIVFNSHGTKASKDRTRWSVCAKSAAVGADKPRAMVGSGPCASKACGSTCKHGGAGFGITAVSACDIAGKCSASLSDLKCETSASQVLVGVTSFWVHDDYDKDTWWGDKGDVYAEVRCEQDDLTWKSQVFHNTLEGDFKLYFYADTKCRQLKLDINDKDDKGSETIMSSEINLDTRGGVRVKSKAKSCNIWGSCNENLAADVTYHVYQGSAASGKLRALDTEGVTLTPPIS